MFECGFFFIEIWLQVFIQAVNSVDLCVQVSVLTEQVEAQGEKIRDLETSLEEHHHKLISTEEMLQQVGAHLYSQSVSSDFLR